MSEDVSARCRHRDSVQSHSFHLGLLLHRERHQDAQEPRCPSATGTPMLAAARQDKVTNTAPGELSTGNAGTLLPYAVSNGMMSLNSMFFLVSSMIGIFSFFFG